MSHASANPTSGPAPLDGQLLERRVVRPGGPAADLLWDFGDGATSTAANPTHTYTQPGPYTGAADRLGRRQRLDLAADHDQRRQLPTATI